jgi:acetylornithine deacetylase
VDTVALWYEGDYRARIFGDTLYGLGAADMKGGCAAFVEALIALKESNVSLKKGLCVALVVGEEEYGDGSEAIVDSLHAPLTIIGEPTSLFPCTAHYGYLECRLVSIGLRAHAALPEVGANAIHGMLTWMAQILNECQTLDFADRLAVNPREIRGGEPGFVVAESCEMLIDFHLPPQAERKPLESVIEKARGFVLQSHRDISLSYEAHFWSPGYNHSGKDRRLIPVRDAYKKMGLVWQTEAFRSHSDAGLFYPTGTLPLVCGPGDLAVAHRRGECVSLTEVERAARLYAAIIYETCVV